MTNGQITRKLLALAAQHPQGGGTLSDAARPLFRSFPLSSEKLLYDSDKPKMTEAAWAALLQAAVDTDAEKLASCNALYADAGCKPETRYGRYVKPQAKKAKKP